MYSAASKKTRVMAPQDVEIQDNIDDISINKQSEIALAANGDAMGAFMT